MTSGGSPKKLQRSVWNQLQALPSSQSQAVVPSLALSLRNISLSPPQHKPLPSSSSSYSSSSSSQHPYFPSRLLTVIHSQCQLRSPLIRTLDLSYSVLDSRTLAELCSWCSKLEVLTAANCGLQGTEKSTRWPSQLRRLDLSRNKLPLIPEGFSVLLCLEKLNLSGNCISYLDPPLLKLPHLQRLYLLKNPIRNVPKTICLGSIDEMRDFLHILPLPVPPNTISFPHPPNVSILNPVSQSPRNRVESVESGYHSEGTLTSIGSNSSLDTEGGRSKCDSITSPAWPKFCRSHIPYGYSEGQSSRCNLCQVFLPPGTPDCVEVKEVRDLSLHPKLPTNQLLITAVVQVSPHGMTFSQDKPAILVLPHCTRPNPHCTEDIVVLCSETTHYQRPQWKQMSEKVGCDLYEECVAFSTTHFSLFTVASVMPYHSASLVISSNEGGRLTVPECPGLEVQIPAGSLSHCEESTITATVYYSDPPTLGHLDGPDSTLSLASPIVGLEPHGIYFLQPVTVSLPVSDYFTIVSSIPEASLQLWTASPSVEALHWSCLNNADLSIHPSNGASHTVSFSVSHFSFFELLWTLCQDSLTRLGTGASLVYSSLRTHYVSIRCQVFMTPPLPDLTFALLVVVYKFGEKLSQLGNYPWLLADSGDRRIFLQTGDLEVELDGCFEPRRECGEKELRQRQILKFAGQDFSLRFAFALKLNSLRLPLQDYQVIGKLRLLQQNEVTPLELNLIKVCIIV